MKIISLLGILTATSILNAQTTNQFSASGSASTNAIIGSQSASHLVGQANMLPRPFNQDATKNFFFEGHGNTTIISDGKNDPNNPNYEDPNGGYMTTKDLKSELGNSVGLFGGLFGVNFPHPYRFVFLDACLTAKTREWQHTFGVRNHVRESQLGRIGAQAFVGWRDEIPAPPSWDDYGDTLTLFYAAWMVDYPLADCINFASDRNSTDPITGRKLTLPLPVEKNKDLWPGTGRRGSSWGRLRTSGYTGITADGYEPGY